MGAVAGGLVCYGQQDVSSFYYVFYFFFHDAQFGWIDLVVGRIDGEEGGFYF